MTTCCDPKFSAKNFKQSIEFQVPSFVDNDTGGAVETWTTFLTAFASVSPKSTRERFFADRVEPLTSHTVRMRYAEGLTTSMRILFGTRIFEIKSIIDVEEENEFLEIMADERTGT